jgi:hypothetical protein
LQPLQVNLLFSLIVPGVNVNTGTVLRDAIARWADEIPA